MVSVPALFVATALILFAPDATAIKGSLCFGAKETLTVVGSTQLRDESGKALELVVKVTEKCVGLPYHSKSEGLFLKAAGQWSTYQRLPPPDELARLQRAAMLPTPLPPDGLPLFEYLVGHSLWILLIGGTIAGSFVFHRVALQFNSDQRVVDGNRLDKPWRVSFLMAAVVMISILAVFALSYVVSWLLSLFGSSAA
jgi:hypothetical protein